MSLLARRLAELWQPWNALPADMLPEEKALVLAGFPRPRFLTRLQKLRVKFWKLPFDRCEYGPALDAAVRWNTRVNFARHTRKKFFNLVNRQWSFREADDQAVGRLAIFRTSRELEITHPGFLENPTPTPAEICHLNQRYQAYSEARQNAFNQLDRLLYRLPGMRKGETVDLLRRALGTPHPPDDLPHHIYIARLDALGICSKRRLHEFFQTDLPALNRSERQEFYRFSQKPNQGKDPYPALKVWIVDNVPVFRAFDWRWPDVHTAAENLGLIDRTKIRSHESLMKMVSNWELAWEMKVGVPPRSQAGEVKRSGHLLSIPPRFGATLQSSASRKA